MSRFSFFFVLLAAVVSASFAQNVSEVLRGEVRIEMDPAGDSRAYVDVAYPLDTETTQKRGLEEAAMLFSAMIYGWSFEYEIGERARKIEEDFQFEPLGAIEWGDPRLFVTGAELRDSSFFMWADYRMDENQIRRFTTWYSGRLQSAQALGYGPLGETAQGGGWLAVKQAALRDAARAALRALLRGGERNRPKTAKGYIALAAFPRYFIDTGRWGVSARFRVNIEEIAAFSAY